MQRYLYTVILLGSLVTAAVGQSVKPAKPSRISFKLNGFRQENRVLLRWMTGDAAQWRYANEKGYVIERAEAGTGRFTPLTAQPIKAITRNQLAAYDSASPVFMSVAFVLNPPVADSMVRKDEQLYSFYFLTASYEPQAAVLSASGYIDSSVVAGKQYDYRITVADNNMHQDTAVWKAPAAAQQLPRAPLLRADFSNRKVTLGWNLKDVAEHYFATVIERSLNDSLHFAAYTIPMVKIRTHENSTEEDFLVNQDDYIANGIPTYYRIKGLNLFGIRGGASNVVSGVAGPDLNIAPVISKVEEVEKGLPLLQWTLPDSVKPVVLKYEIWQSRLPDTGYKKVGEVKAGVPFLQEMAVKPMDVNYFVVKAIGTRAGQITTSVPYLYQPIDSIAPAAPQPIAGIADSNGVVTLTWKPNKEADMLGYRILKSTRVGSEFVLMNATPVTGTSYHDTIAVKQLNSFIFYKVVAVDGHYNESKASAPLQVRRPDKIPPAPARLKTTRSDNKRIYVGLVPSFSKDVAHYRLFRMAAGDSASQWQQIALLDKNDTVYADKAVKEAVLYSYAVQAVDEAGLVSPLSAVVKGEIPRSKEAPRGVKNLNVYISREYKYIELNWSNGEDNAKRYLLYKAGNDGKLTLIATLPADKKKYVDEEVQPSHTYRYAVKVVYENGKGSKLEKIEAVY